MSCNVGHAMEPRDSASSQLPGGSDCCRGGSGDPPIRHHNHVAQPERTPLQGISSNSNATEGGFRTKGKRRASELQGSMASGNNGSGSINVETNHRKRLSLGQKLELLDLLGAGTTKAEIARCYACSEVTVRQIAGKKNELQLKKKSLGFKDKARGEMPIRFPQMEDEVSKKMEDARMHRVPITGEDVMSFGRVVKTQVLHWTGISEGERARLASFGASEK